MIDRKTFLKNTVKGIFGLIGLNYLFSLKSIFKSKNQILGKINGANHQIGHILRDIHTGQFKIENYRSIHYKKDIVIIGSGVSGLAAARNFENSGIKDFEIFELEDYIGGNAASSNFDDLRFPTGAHYLPIPNLNNEELIAFLHENDVITGFDENKIPTYNDYYLCHTPNEKLFLRGKWQDGIIPNYGVSSDEKNQISRFLKLMEDFKSAKGNDGLWAFTIPIQNSSADSVFRNLDKISMESWLSNHDFNSEYLFWYINYCCRDDYGMKMQEVSAYAGIHYFAARKGKATNAESNDVLTWPEGNQFLVDCLAKNIESKISTKHLVTKLNVKNNAIELEVFDWEKQIVKKITAKKVVLAIPQFIARRLLPPQNEAINLQKFQYQPWLTANILFKTSAKDILQHLAWDNVFYHFDSLGFISNRHQSISRKTEKQVLTYYLPLSTLASIDARKKVSKQTYDDFEPMILAELKQFSDEIEEHIEKIEIKIWGHGMISPSIDFLFSDELKKANLPFNDNIHFAHSDLSGISIFEEAFFQGNKVAKLITESFKNA